MESDVKKGSPATINAGQESSIVILVVMVGVNDCGDLVHDLVLIGVECHWSAQTGWIEPDGLGHLTCTEQIAM